MSISALAAAKTICELGDWEVSNLQLQKILYITHMAFMGENKGAPLIEERFEAWEYGPVVPSLYYKLRHYGSKRIRVIFSKEDISGTPEEAELKRACDGLLSKEVSDLVAFTHRTGGAWDKHYKSGERGIIIPNSDILEEYNKEMGNGR